MRQADTPEQWQVERPECCNEVDVSDLATTYSDGADYRCTECGAEYDWDGGMAVEPDLITATDGGNRRDVDTDTDRSDGGDE
jgi:hypothetical protein